MQGGQILNRPGISGFTICHKQMCKYLYITDALSAYLYQNCFQSYFRKYEKLPEMNIHARIIYYGQTTLLKMCDSQIWLFVYFSMHNVVTVK